MLSLWRNRTARRAPELFLVASVLALAVSACRKKAEPKANGGPPAGSASARAAAAPSSAPPTPFECRELRNGAALTLGTPPTKPARVDDEEDEEDRNVELPFAVELGNVATSGSHFAVAGLESQRGQNHAFVALVSSEQEPAARIELGRVFGDVEPPAIVPYRAGFVALIADSDASSVVLKLAALDAPFDDKSLRRGGEISGVRRDACDFSLATHENEGLVAFTKLEKGHGSIALARLDLDKLTPKGNAVAAPVSGSGEAESPRLVQRPGGYFLAFIVRGVATPPKAALGRPSEYDAGLVDQGLVDEGPTALEVVPLSNTGAPLNAPRRITPATAHVLAFEIAATPDGGALVVYRDDREGPGLDRAGVDAVLVRPDGSTDTRNWDFGETAGLPSLLVDGAPGAGKPWAWLHVPSEAESRVTPLSPNSLEVGEARTAPELAASELLALRTGRFLRVRTRGGQRALSVIECSGGAAR